MTFILHGNTKGEKPQAPAVKPPVKPPVKAIEPEPTAPQFADIPDSDDKNESFLTKLSRELILNEMDNAEYMEKLQTKSSEIRPNLKNIEEFDDVADNIDTAAVRKDELFEIFEQAVTALKFRANFGQPIPSIAIFGPPGTAKTALTKYFAEQGGFNLKRIEVAGLYKEAIGGFPVVVKDKETGKEMVGLQAMDIFPPSEDVSDSWILFFDEFNKDSDKMNAAMNLILTGELGSHYRLPLKTMVIMAGNLGVEDSTTVSSMDSAVFDRFSRKVVMSYDTKAQLDYQERNTDSDVDDAFNFDPKKAADSARKGIENFSKGLVQFSEKEKEVLHGGKDAQFKYALVSSLRLFLAHVTEEAGGDYDRWAMDPKNHIQQLSMNDTDTKAAYITLRTWTKMGDNLKYAAVTDWINHLLHNKPLPGNHPVEFYEKGWKQAGFKGPIEYYLEVNQWNKKYIPEILRTMLGKNPSSLISDILSYTAEEKKRLKSMSFSDLLTGFMWRVKSFDPKTVKTELQYLVEQLPMQTSFELQNVRTDAELENYIKEGNKDFKPCKLKVGGEEVTFSTFKDYYDHVSGGDPVHLVATNIIFFFKKINLPEDSAGALLKKLNELGRGEFMGDNGKETGEKNQIALDLISSLAQFKISPNPFKVGWKSVAIAESKSAGLAIYESTIFGKLIQELKD